MAHCRRSTKIRALPRPLYHSRFCSRCLLPLRYKLLYLFWVLGMRPTCEEHENFHTIREVVNGLTTLVQTGLARKSLCRRAKRLSVEFLMKFPQLSHQERVGSSRKLHERSIGIGLPGKSETELTIETFVDRMKGVHPKIGRVGTSTEEQT